MRPLAPGEPRYFRVIDALNAVDDYFSEESARQRQLRRNAAYRRRRDRRRQIWQRLRSKFSR